MVLSAAVSSGVITAVQAWPEYFEGAEPGGGQDFPAADADMSGFELEEATPESFAADMAALVAASQQVTLREEPAPDILPAGAVPDVEWT